MSERPARYLSEDDHRRDAPKILQLLPAGGWGAVYPFRDRKTKEIELHLGTLVCWAVIEMPHRPDDAEAPPFDGQAVVGLVLSGSSAIMPANMLAAFLGYASSHGNLEQRYDMFLRRAEAYYAEQDGEA